MVKKCFSNNKDIDVVLITSNELRHKYVASFINDNYNLVGILSEQKTKISRQKEDDKLVSEIIKSHFESRTNTELKVFGEYYDFPHGVDVLHLGRGESNSAESFTWVSSKTPDVIILYGSCIIKDPLLSYYNNLIVNMHLGLSPYYRGSGTNFWPLVDRLPECVGVTIHLAVSSVDAGPILIQKRPDILYDDHSHEIGTKAIIAGLHSIREIILPYLNGEVDPIDQDLSLGKEYRKKDFSVDSVHSMHQQFKSGMIKEFIENHESREAKYPVIVYEK